MPHPTASPAAPPASSNVYSSAMQEAVRLLRLGRTASAEGVMVAEVARVAAQFGKPSAELAAASNELGIVLLNAGQKARAVEAYHDACAGPWPKEREAVQDRLTYLANLGQALEWADRLDEAEQTLRTGLDGRRAFYGREHPGYAMGLEPLALLLLRTDRAGAALEMLDESAENFARNRHPRVTGALALRAEAIIASGRQAQALGELDTLGPDAVAQVAERIFSRIHNPFPGQSQRTPRQLLVMRRLLAELTPALQRRLGADHPAVLRGLTTAAHVEAMLGDAGDAEIRLTAAREVVAIHDRAARPRDALLALLAIALAHAEAGREDRAAQTYELALERADRLGDPLERSQTLRNFGLCLSHLGRDADAERRLREATTAASAGSGPRQPEILALSQIALGIFLQHGGHLKEARELLRSALAQIDPAHPESVAARSHFAAIETGGSCGCGDSNDALAEAFRQFAVKRLPADFPAELRVRLKDGDFKIDVDASRDMSRAEIDEMDRVIRHAANEFRRRLGGEA